MDTVGREKRIETVEKENEKSNIDTKKESYLRRKRQKGKCKRHRMKRERNRKSKSQRKKEIDI